MDWRGLVVFVVLAGGDYDDVGLRGCGPKAAMRISAHDGGKLGQVLCSIPENHLRGWNQLLVNYLRELRISVDVPLDFPKALPVKHYRSPKVSSTAEVNDLRGLRRGWDLAIDETKLRVFLRERFNIWAKGYLNHMTPLLLTKKLRDTAHVAENHSLAIQLLKPKRKKIVDDQESAVFERKISYLPLHVTTLDMSICPPDEDWLSLETKKDGPFFPRNRIEIEVLDCLLEQGIGKENLDNMLAEAAVEPPKKRKSKDDVDSISDAQMQDTTVQSAASEQPTKKRKGKTHQLLGDAGLVQDEHPLQPAKGRRPIKRSDPIVVAIDVEDRTSRRFIRPRSSAFWDDWEAKLVEEHSELEIVDFPRSAATRELATQRKTEAVLRPSLEENAPSALRTKPPGAALIAGNVPGSVNFPTVSTLDSRHAIAEARLRHFGGSGAASNKKASALKVPGPLLPYDFDSPIRGRLPLSALTSKSSAGTGKVDYIDLTDD